MSTAPGALTGGNGSAATTEADPARRQRQPRETGFVMLVAQTFTVVDEGSTVEHEVVAYVPVGRVPGVSERQQAVRQFLESEEGEALNLKPGDVLSPVPISSWQPKPLRAPDRPALIY